MGRNLGGHNTNDDSCESTKSTQDILGCSIRGAGGTGARRIRAAASAAGGARGTARTRGGSRVRVGRPKWLDFEGFGGGVNLETMSWARKPRYQQCVMMGAKGKGLRR